MFQNDAKILPNRSQNGPTSEFVWGSGRLLGAIGHFWLQGSSGLVPGRFLGSSCAILEPSWAPLGSSWEPLELDFNINFEKYPKTL